MNLDLQDKIQKVGTDVTTIKDAMDSLKSDVASLGNRINEAEGRVSQLEDATVRLSDLTTKFNGKIIQLESRVQYQENYSRRNNLRIKGVPEDMEGGRQSNGVCYGRAAVLISKQRGEHHHWEGSPRPHSTKTRPFKPCSRTTSHLGEVSTLHRQSLGNGDIYLERGQSWLLPRFH